MLTDAAPNPPDEYPGSEGDGGIRRCRDEKEELEA
jgi:hypothetical protein